MEPVAAAKREAGPSAARQRGSTVFPLARSRRAALYHRLRRITNGIDDSGDVVITAAGVDEAGPQPEPIIEHSARPEVIDLAQRLGLIGPAQKAFYDSLPVRGDPDDIPNDKDDFLKELVRQQVAPFGYDPIGLSGSPITAALLKGDYIAVHTYGWTEFQIVARTQELVVTTWGIEPYSETVLLASPGVITLRHPKVVSKFLVAPARR